MRLLLTLMILSAILLFAFLVRDRVYRREFFGTSPGTMVQLASSHVPTQEDMNYALKGYAQQVNHDLIDMTGQGLYA